MNYDERHRYEQAYRSRRMDDASAARIQALRNEAAAAADPETVQDCDDALAGDAAARDRCRRIMDDARAQNDAE